MITKKQICTGTGLALGALVIHGHTFGVCQKCFRMFTKTDQAPGTATPRHYLNTQTYG